MSRLLALPLFLILAGLSSAAMVAPAILALRQGFFHDARSFFYTGIIGLVLCAMVAIAQSSRPHNRNALRQLLGLLAGFVFLPAILAVPFFEAVRNTTFLNAYFEMLSALTTTGITLFEPERLSDAEHLWRALVAWLGGLLMWIAAAAILAPLTIGGFEVTGSGEPGQSLGVGTAQADHADPAKRLARSTYELMPVYLTLTLVLWILLMIVGDRPFVALIHAMSVMSTSGITSVDGLAGAASGRAGEMLMFCFLFFALSRLTFSSDTVNTARPGLRYDPEFRLGLVLVLGVPLILFMRHFIAAFDVGDEQNFLAALRALWGALFTVLSFLSTTGFESADWGAAQTWSGLQTSSLILMGLAVMGGGVATTAGGVKLLRVFALYLNGKRELEKLVHPSSVGRAGLFSRRIRREGAFIAWVFFMLFAITLAGLTVGLAGLGSPFHEAMLLAVATLSNTGPLVTAAAEAPIDLVSLEAPAKLLMCLGMVLGRLEVLAIIVMLTPDLWRN